MISLQELLMGRAKFEELPADVQANLKTLLERINKLRAAYGKPMKVNDGYRRPVDTPKNGAAKSKHLSGLAVDLDDDDAGTLWKWIFQNRKLLKQIGLWLEHPNWTHGAGSWIHIQIVPPASGKRFFVPSTKPAPAPNFWDGKYEKELDDPTIDPNYGESPKPQPEAPAPQAAPQPAQAEPQKESFILSLLKRLFSK